MDVKKFFFLTFFLLIHSTGAQLLEDVNVVPAMPWIGEYVQVSARCIANESVSVSVQLTYPILTPELQLEPVGGDEYGKTLPWLFDETGTYQGILVCRADGRDNITSISFVVKDLRAHVSMPASFYPDTAWQITARVIQLTDATSQLKQGVEFEVYANGQLISSPHYYHLKTERWVIQPERLEAGEYVIDVKIGYEGKSLQVSKRVEVKPILVAHVKEVGYVWPGESLTIPIALTYYGNVTSLKLAELSVKIDGEDVTLEDVTDSSISLIAPHRAPGDYQLNISISYGGLRTDVSTTLTYPVVVEGRLSDAAGKAVDGKLIFEKADFRREIVISKGVYSAPLPSGDYSIEFIVPRRLTALFHGVDISSDARDVIRYDYFAPHYKLPGLKVAGGVALEFALEFERVELEIWYDSRRIADETQLKVYRCPNWNLASRACADEWIEVEAEMDTIRDVVRVTSTSISSFLIGEKAKLELLAKTDKSEYYLNEPVEIDGVVRDELGNLIPDAEVSYKINDKVGKTHTTDEGTFSLSFSAPSEPGHYKIYLTVNKTNYEADERVLGVSVVVKKDVTIISGLQQTIQPGENVTVNIKVLNSGQAALHNLRVSISGVPTEWIEWEPKGWDALAPGEETKVSLRISTPPDAELRSHRLRIDVKSDEVEKSDTFVLILQPRVEEEQPPPTPPTIPIARIIAIRWLLPDVIFFILIGVLIIVIFLPRRRKRHRDEIVRLLGEMKTLTREAGGRGRVTRSKYRLLRLEKW